MDYLIPQINHLINAFFFNALLNVIACNLHYSLQFSNNILSGVQF